ncbi:CL2D3 protein, partial [Polypterus senegalus]
MKKLAYIEETEKICSMQNLHKYIISLNDKFEEFKSDISKAYQECNRNQTSENDIFKQHLLRRVCTNGTGNKGLPCFLCPFDWLQYKDMCYFISKENKTWFESRNYCIAAKADLSEFKDPHHLTFLQEKLNEGEGGYWIGLRQQSSIEPWKWLDGTTLDVKQSPFHVVTNSGSSHVYITKKNIFTGMAQNKKMCICSRSAASV